MRTFVGCAALLASLLWLSSCCIPGRHDDPAPPPDPSLNPPPAQPPPTTPTTQVPGGFQIPGLEGITIPVPAPNGNAPDPSPPARGSLAAPPPGSFDANGHMTRPFLEQEATMIHRALIDALDARERDQTRDIPFEVVSEDREPNAAAGCLRATRTAAMMITSAMLVLAAGISEAKAYDELANTQTYEQYVTSVIDAVRSERPIPAIDPGLHTAPNATDAHKLARQRHLYDQQIAFIVGHELAHHYRGHTDCVAGRTNAEMQRDELRRIVSRSVPPFSQPNEVEADMWGLVSVLEAGRTRQGGTWTQEGGLLNMDFFRRLSEQGGQNGRNIVLAFLSTHPPAMVRMPIVRSIAQQWHPGWRPPVMPAPGDTGLPAGLPIPGGPNGPIQLPTKLPIDPSQFPFPLPQPQQQP